MGQKKPYPEEGALHFLGAVGQQVTGPNLLKRLRFDPPLGVGDIGPLLGTCVVSLALATQKGLRFGDSGRWPKDGNLCRNSSVKIRPAVCAASATANLHGDTRFRRLSKGAT